MKSSQYIEEKLDIRPHRCLLVKFMEYSAKESLHYPNSGFMFENLMQLTYNPTYFAHRIIDKNGK